MQKSRERDAEVEIKSRMEKFYNEKKEKIEELTHDLKLQKENDIAKLKTCTEKVIDELKSENKSLQKDLN